MRFIKSLFKLTKLTMPSPTSLRETLTMMFFLEESSHTEPIESLMISLETGSWNSHKKTRFSNQFLTDRGEKNSTI
jgi:hypothetical protein